MILRQWRQVLGLEEPLKTQTRRIRFPYALAVQLWKHGWSYPRLNKPPFWKAPNVRWAYWLERFPITDAHITDANFILFWNTITLPVQPGRGKKAVGRMRITDIGWEKLLEISVEDCFAEGIFEIQEGNYASWFTYPGGKPHVLPIVAYCALWDSIHGKDVWERNDDVWVLELQSEGTVQTRSAAADRGDNREG